MGEYEVVRQLRLQPHRDHGARCGDEPVHHGQAALQGRPDDEPRDAADLESSHLAQYIQGICSVRSVHLDAPPEEHDHVVCRDGVYDTAISAIRAALSAGFRVTTNSTLFTDADSDRYRHVVHPFCFHTFYLTFYLSLNTRHNSSVSSTSICQINQIGSPHV